MSGLPNTIEEVNNLDLNYIDKWERDMIIDALQAIVRANDVLKKREINVWDYLSKFSPSPNRGFMFCDDEIVSIIQREMETGHSGSSMAWTMRVIELIAKQGLVALPQYFNRQQRSV
jgi:hypothetical protein